MTKTQIDAATTTAAVDTIVSGLQTALAAIKTDAQYSAEEQAAADAVVVKIDAIGTVTLQSETAITEARQAYDALSDLEKAKVPAAKVTVLTDAEARLAELKAAAELEAYKAAAKEDLDDWVTAHLSEYRQAEQTQITQGIATGKGQIDAATSKAAVDAVMADLEQQLASIKTAAQYEAEEAEAAAQALAAAKTAAKAQLDSYKNASDYRSAEQAQLATIVANGKAAIDAATTEAGVASALADAKALADALKTKAQYEAEDLTILSSLMRSKRCLHDVWQKEKCAAILR